MATYNSMASTVLLLALLCTFGVPARAYVPGSDAPQRSRQELEKAATHGDAEAQFQLGLLAQRAGNASDGEQTALAWFRKAAQQGHVRAQYELGHAYSTRLSDERNLPLALKWLMRAAEHGYAEAWLALGDLYAEGGPGVFRGDLYFYRAEGDLRGKVDAIDTRRCPLYLLTGEYDFSCTPDDTRRTAAAIKGARVTVMKGIGHFPMSEHPAQFRTYLLPVLDEIRAHAARP